MWWPIIVRYMSRNAPYITLPFAAIVGVIGYNIENILSDKYTPYSKPIQEQRVDRLTEENKLNDPTKVDSLRYQENVLGKNVSPSLRN